MFYVISRTICFLLFKVLFRYKIYGQENLPREGPYIIASNHLSFLDPIALGLLTRERINFMATHELFRNKIFTLLIKNLGALPLNRDRHDIKALREVIRLLRQNKIIVIFPEGTRSPDGILGQPLGGVGVLAKQVGVKVVPVYLEGTNLALPLDAYFIRLKKIRAFVGRAISPGAGSASMIVQKTWEEIHNLKDKALLVCSQNKSYHFKE